jgi:hypothetical protein
MPGVMTARPGVAGMLQMVSELTLAVSRARIGQLRRVRTWVHTHDAWVLWHGHDMVRMLLTGRMVHVCQYLTYRRGQEGTFLA